MIELFSLVKSLNADEQKAIKASFRRVISTDADGFLLEKLYHHILSEENKVRSDKQLSLLIYKVEKLPAIVKLKSRLFNFVLEILSSDSLLQKDDLFDASDKQIIRIRKKMLQFRVIYRKKNRAEFLILYHLLNEIIKEAKGYEQYDILVEALIFKKYLLMLRKEFSEIKEIIKSISFYTKVHQMMLVANDYYFNLIVDQEIVNKLTTLEKQKMLKSAVNELEKYVKSTNSASIEFIKKILELEYLISENKHDKTIDLCQNIIAFLNKHRHIYRDAWMGCIYDNLSQCQVYKQDYKAGLLSSQKAQTFYPEKSNSMLASKQQEFYALFYSEQFQMANEKVKELLNSSIVNAGDFRYDKFLFLNACTLFKLGFFQNALEVCNQTLEITKDKLRWDIGVRYLKFMCLVEIGDCDGAQKSIEAYRQSLNRKKQVVSSRDELIYKMLNEYCRKGFSPTPSAKLETIWNKLASKNDTNSWNYYTHELIPINTWIEKRVKFKSSKK